MTRWLDTRGRGRVESAGGMRRGGHVGAGGRGGCGADGGGEQRRFHQRRRPFTSAPQSHLAARSGAERARTRRPRAPAVNSPVPVPGRPCPRPPAAPSTAADRRSPSGAPDVARERLDGRLRRREGRRRLKSRRRPPRRRRVQKLAAGPRNHRQVAARTEKSAAEELTGEGSGI